MAMTRDDVNLAGTVVGLIAAAAGAIAWAYSIITADLPNDLLGGYLRALAAVGIGLAGAGGYGVIWMLAEKLVLHTSYGPGVGGLPKGLEAVVLSFATTLPLTFFPPIAQAIFTVRLVYPWHFRASVAMIIAAALGHVILYGTKTPATRGLRAIVFPHGMESPTWGRAIQMEIIYALVHFFSTVFVYQIAVHASDFGFWQLWLALRNTIASGLIFFFGASATVSLIAFGNREWLTDPKWVGVRGITNGVILMVALTLGILM
jgi:hypothetical protein